jgi:hypothetical protein
VGHFAFLQSPFAFPVSRDVTIPYGRCEEMRDNQLTERCLIADGSTPSYIPHPFSYLCTASAKKSLELLHEGDWKERVAEGRGGEGCLVAPVRGEPEYRVLVKIVLFTFNFFL